MDAAARLTVVYDEDCGFCRWTADRIRAWDRRRRLRFVAIQAADDLLGPVPVEERLASMHAVTADGRVFSGGAAGGPILRALPGGRALATLVEAAPVSAERAYRAVARRRTTLGRILGAEACRVDPSRPA